MDQDSAYLVFKNILKKRAPILFKLAKKSNLIIKNLRARSYVKRFWVDVKDVVSYCRKQKCTILFSHVSRKTYIKKPIIFSNNQQSYSFAYGEAELPLVYLADLRKVTVVEGSDLVITKDKTALYDEISLDKDCRYGLRITSPFLIEADRKSFKLNLEYKKSDTKPIKKAIHFCKDHSGNYFHWLVECLPRLWTVEQHKEFDGWPLLVDSHLKSQQLESLNLITMSMREIITLKHCHGYKVDRLIYPSNLSYIHDNYNYAIQYNKDVVISPLAIQYVRDRIKSLACLNPTAKASKKIFLSRKNLGQMRRLLNEEEIAETLEAKGFEIIYPETLSFLEQVILFSQSNVIVSAAGSALANIIFAPKNCKVFVLSTNKRFYPYLFDMIADTVGCQTYNIVGEERKMEDNFDRGVHNPFIVDIEYFTSLINSYL